MYNFIDQRPHQLPIHIFSESKIMRWLYCQKNITSDCLGRRLKVSILNWLNFFTHSQLIQAKDDDEKE
jgi:hypothetical protein